MVVLKSVVSPPPNECLVEWKPRHLGITHWLGEAPQQSLYVHPG